MFLLLLTMSASAAKPAVAPKPTPIGLTALGAAVYEPFQPSVASLAVSLTPFLQTQVGMDTVFPLPAGLAMRRSPGDRQNQLVVAAFFARKLRRMYGYVAEIVLTEGDGTETPAQMQIVTKIPWKFGASSRACDRSTNFYPLAKSVTAGCWSEYKLLSRKRCSLSQPR